MKLFEVKNYYHVFSTPISSHFPWKGIWKVETPSKVEFFVWTVALGKILTLDNLRKGNIVVNWCCMYKKSGESIDHLYSL
jgi:hypothetical protein